MESEFDDDWTVISLERAETLRESGTGLVDWTFHSSTSADSPTVMQTNTSTVIKAVRKSEGENLEDAKVTQPPVSQKRFYNTLKTAPGMNLDFPANANILAAEWTCFLPNSLKSYPVAERLMNNGFTYKILAHMLGHFRESGTSHNTILKGIQATMWLGPASEQPRENWDMSSNMPPSSWDETSCSTAGYQPRYRTHPALKSSGPMKIVGPIPFKDLARGVVRWPRGPDCGDLTSCVAYHLQHPDEDWLYPTDFTRLINHIGGSMAISTRHQDPQAVSRWQKALAAENSMLHYAG